MYVDKTQIALVMFSSSMMSALVWAMMVWIKVKHRCNPDLTEELLGKKIIQKSSLVFLSFEVWSAALITYNAIQAGVLHRDLGEPSLLTLPNQYFSSVITLLRGEIPPPLNQPMFGVLCAVQVIGGMALLLWGIAVYLGHALKECQTN